LSAFLVVPHLLADQITLKNGDRISGKIVTSDEKSLTLKSEFAGEIKIDRAGIVTITSDAPLNVTGKAGPPSTGRVETVGEELRVGGQPVRLADAMIRDDASQKAWEREQERINHPKLNDFWAGSITFNLASASGNASTTAMGASANATRTAGRNKMGLYFNQVYATQSTAEPFGATANSVRGGFRVDRDLSNKLFVFGFTDFDYNEFLSLDLRSVLGGGLGYHILKNDKGFWDFGAGGSWNREKFADGLVRNAGELLFSEESSYNLLSKVTWSQRASFFPNLSETGEYRFNFDTNATVPVLKWMEWNVGYSLRYLSNPPVGKVSRDTMLTTGVRVSFDQTKR
jgi:putative salt-induced outer membrane protein YdiY